ncbi:hypothetical protein POM88_026151 [Heracleum sosnowskyi]|uniref:Uncharacterized protein n=1 Tax=Heracleum sosnowskyi TaxID=360622 RepID=A0AAD8I7J6_9APIA|nr:hypothetical protein POM88_026151 [Heracleum sosnowskyi]
MAGQGRAKAGAVKQNIEQVLAKYRTRQTAILTKRLQEIVRSRKILPGFRPRFGSTQGRASEAFGFGGFKQAKFCEMYLPDDDQTKELLAIACNVKGFNIETIRVPSQAEEFGINLDEIETLDTSSYFALFGFTILLLFKTPTTANFQHFLVARQNALNAAAGVQPDKEVPNPYSLEKAQAVRSILGSSIYVKRRVIRMLLDMQNGDKNLNNVCRYVASVLEYNEMSAIMFSYETLVQTNSPVLTDPRLYHEVLNLDEALQLMFQSKHPQYFRYLEDQEKVSMIERKRFPILAAVGEKLKADLKGYKSSKNVVGANSNKDNMVAELVATHKRAMARNKSVKIDASAQSLCQPAGPRVTEIDDEEEEEGMHD